MQGGRGSKTGAILVSEPAVSTRATDGGWQKRRKSQHVQQLKRRIGVSSTLPAPARNGRRRPNRYRRHSVRIRSGSIRRARARAGAAAGRPAPCESDPLVLRRGGQRLVRKTAAEFGRQRIRF